MNIVVVWVAVLAGSSFAGSYGGGAGTPEDPYQIWTAEQMDEIGQYEEDWDKHFILKDDIDLSVLQGQLNKIGKFVGDDPANKPFTGTFDGNGCTISSFVYHSTDESQVGIFSYVKAADAVIKNVNLSNCDVNASGASNDAGPLIGYIESGYVLNCHVLSGTVHGRTRVGGLAGQCAGAELRNCSSSANVTGAHHVGGLVGQSRGGSEFPVQSLIEDCHAAGNVQGATKVGGLVGSNWWGATNRNCMATGDVDGDNEVGGYVGKNRPRSHVILCSATGKVTATGSDAGGFVGLNDKSTIEKSCATGQVSAAGYYVGGFIGRNGSSTIIQCSSLGNATAERYVGGFVGAGSANVYENCYSTSDVIPGDGSTQFMGGFVGKTDYWGSFQHCYSTGKLPATGYKVGGFIGNNWTSKAAEIITCFWNTDTSGRITSDGGEGRTNDEMMRQATYIGWDFTDVWRICEDDGYPRLRWQIPAADFACPDGVNLIDFAVLAKAWQSIPTDENWDLSCDLDGDEHIGVGDLSILSEQWLSGI